MWHVTHCYTFWVTISTQKWDQCFRHYLHIWYHRLNIMKLKLLGFLPFFIKNEWKNISPQNDAYLHEKIACLVYKSIHIHILSTKTADDRSHHWISRDKLRIYFNLHTARLPSKKTSWKSMFCHMICELRVIKPASISIKITFFRTFNACYKFSTF